MRPDLELPLYLTGGRGPNTDEAALGDHIIAELNREADVETVYEKLIEAAVVIMHSDFASMQMLYPNRGEQGELRLLAFRGFNSEAVRYWQWVRADSSCSCGVALKLRRRVVFHDVEEGEFLAGTSDLATYRATGIRAVQSTPLISRRGILVGMISTHWRTPHHPEERDLRRLDQLADYAANLIERRRDEETIRYQQQQLYLIADIAPVNIAQCDRNGRFVFVNRPYAARLGLEPAQLVGRRIQDVIGEEAFEVIRPHLERALAGETVTYEAEISYATIGSRWVLTRYAPERDEHNRVRGVVAAVSDITERKQTQEALREANELLANRARHLDELVTARTAELKETNEQLEAFVYSIAHDLRAPLRSITGFAEILGEDYPAQLDENARHMLKRIRASSEFMDRLLIDLLVYGRAARAEIELQPVNVRDAWENARFLCANDIDQAQADVEVIEPLPDVRAHLATLSQIFGNLLGNGLKFVNPGCTPRVTLRAENVGKNIRLWIEDNGIGIPRESQERVFRVFERLHGTRFTGTGIGLSIVRKGVERMGGCVGVESEPGHGSRFWIELPKAKVDREEA